jgi:hypothetical protein
MASLVAFIGVVPLGRISFDGTISTGDLLTVAAILVSLATLLSAWSRERKARSSDRANAVRTAATTTLAKLERWEELAIFFYEEIQPVFIDVSKSLSPKDFDRPRARDSLWRGLTELRVKTHERILDEDIELAYVGLQVYDSRVYSAVATAVSRLREVEQEVFWRFLERDAQGAVLALQGPDDYEPAQLGNALRSAAAGAADALRRETSEALESIRAFLLETVALDDEELLGRRERRRLVETVP